MGLVERFQAFVEKAEARVQLPTKAIYARLNITPQDVPTQAGDLSIRTQHGEAYLRIEGYERFVDCRLSYTSKGQTYFSLVKFAVTRDKDFAELVEVYMDNVLEESKSRDEIASVLTGIGKQIAAFKKGELPQVQRTTATFSPLSRLVTRLAGLYHSRPRYSLRNPL